jgi:CRP-like cAMP-binding protein
LSYSAFQKLMKNSADWERVGRVIAERTLVDREKREAQLLTLSGTERYQSFRRDFPGLCDRLPQYLIASYLGLTPVALSRIKRKRAKTALDFSSKAKGHRWPSLRDIKVLRFHRGLLTHHFNWVATFRALVGA